MPLNRKTSKICALTRQPRAISSHKLQPSVLFSTINILFRIAISCKVKQESQGNLCESTICDDRPTKIPLIFRLLTKIRMIQIREVVLVL